MLPRYLGEYRLQGSALEAGKDFGVQELADANDAGGDKIPAEGADLAVVDAANPIAQVVALQCLRGVFNSQVCLLPGFEVVDEAGVIAGGTVAQSRALRSVQHLATTWWVKTGSRAQPPLVCLADLLGAPARCQGSGRPPPANLSSNNKKHA